MSYSNLGRYQEAIELTERVIEGYRRTLGSEHPDTLWAIESLSYFKDQKCRVEETSEVLKEVSRQPYPQVHEDANQPKPAHTTRGQRLVEPIGETSSTLLTPQARPARWSLRK